MIKYFNKFQFIIFLSIIFLFNSFVFAQGILKGKVIDVKGEPIIGANVFLQGTTLGAATDFEGNYTIKSVPEGNYTLTRILKQSNSTSIYQAVQLWNKMLH